MKVREFPLTILSVGGRVPARPLAAFAFTVAYSVTFSRRWSDGFYKIVAASTLDAETRCKYGDDFSVQNISVRSPKVGS